MTAIDQYFPVVLFIMLYKVVLKFECVEEIIERDHSNESYWAQYFRAVYTYCLLSLCKVGPSSLLKFLKDDHWNENYWAALPCIWKIIELYLWFDVVQNQFWNLYLSSYELGSYIDRSHKRVKKQRGGTGASLSLFSLEPILLLSFNLPFFLTERRSRISYRRRFGNHCIFLCKGVYKNCTIFYAKIGAHQQRQRASGCFLFRYYPL